MSERSKGTLYLIPVALGGDDATSLVPPATLDAARRLNTFIAENAKSCRLAESVDQSFQLLPQAFEHSAFGFDDGVVSQTCRR